MVFIRHVLLALALLMSGVLITVLPRVGLPWVPGWIFSLGFGGTGIWRLVQDVVWHKQRRLNQRITTSLFLVGIGIFFALPLSLASDFTNWAFLFGSVGAQLWILIAAIELRRRRTPNFDMIVASELLIAFGVFSLIIGIVVAGVVTLNNYKTGNAITTEVLKTALIPFGEGLFASGLGPLLASLLRQIEVLRYGDDGKSAIESESPDLPGLVNKVAEAIKALDGFSASWRRSEVILTGASATLMASAEVYSRAAQKIDIALSGLATDVEKSGKRFTGEVDRAAISFGNLEARANAGMADLLKKGHAGLNDLHNHAEKNLKDFNSTSKEAAATLGDLADKTRAFSKAAEEGTTLLAGLQKLIESVDNFIHPSRARF